MSKASDLYDKLTDHSFIIGAKRALYLFCLLLFFVNTEKLMQKERQIECPIDKKTLRNRPSPEQLPYLGLTAKTSGLCLQVGENLEIAQKAQVGEVVEQARSCLCSPSVYFESK